MYASHFRVYVNTIGDTVQLWDRGRHGSYGFLACLDGSKRAHEPLLYFCLLVNPQLHETEKTATCAEATLLYDIGKSLANTE